MCHTHFTQRKSCFIYMVGRAVCLQAKPPWYHMAVIIWMLWCTSTVRVPRECSLSLNTLSRWHLKHTEWIWMLDCALHLQTVGVGARKLSSDCSTNHSLCLNRGTNVKKKRVAGLKSPLSVSLYSMYQASLLAVHLFSLCWYRQNMSVWSCTLRMYAVRPQQALKYQFFQACLLSGQFMFWV